MIEDEVVTPALLARRLAAEGVLMNAATAWAFLRSRAAEEYPGCLERGGPVELRLPPDAIAALIDELLLHVADLRSTLSRSIIAAEQQGGQVSFGP